MVPQPPFWPEVADYQVVMSRGSQLIGKRFGKLVVKTKLTERTSAGYVRWECECDCGNTHVAHSGHLNRGYVKSCGCGMSHNLVDITGLKFDMLTVLSISTEKHHESRVKWNCVCDCGKNVVAIGRDLRLGKTTSCGCKKINRLKEMSGENHPGWRGNYKKFGSLAWCTQFLAKNRLYCTDRGYAPMDISPEDLMVIFANSDGNCEIHGGPCKRGKRLCVDHCHETGQVRGLVCGACNTGLGMFQDNPELMKNAIKYLKKSKQLV